MLALPGVQHRPFLPMVASVRHLPPQALYGGLAGAMPFIPMPMTAYRPHLGHRYPPPRHKINKKKLKPRNHYPSRIFNKIIIKLQIKNNI